MAICAFLTESIITAHTYIDTLINFLSLYLCLFQLKWNTTLHEIGLLENTLSLD